MHAGEPAPDGDSVGGRDVIAAAHLDEPTAVSVAATLQALATPSRLLILTALRRSAYSVTELATAVGMAQSAVSHQPSTRCRRTRTARLTTSHR